MATLSKFLEESTWKALNTTPAQSRHSVKIGPPSLSFILSLRFESDSILVTFSGTYGT